MLLQNRGHAIVCVKRHINGGTCRQTEKSSCGLNAWRLWLYFRGFGIVLDIGVMTVVKMDDKRCERIQIDSMIK